MLPTTPPDPTAGIECPISLRSIHRLGDTLLALGNLGEAERLQREAVKGLTAVYGPESEPVILATASRASSTAAA